MIEEVVPLLLVILAFDVIRWRLVFHVGLDVKQDLEVSEVRVLGQVEQRSSFFSLSRLFINILLLDEHGRRVHLLLVNSVKFQVVVLVVVHNNVALFDEVHFFHVGLVADDRHVSHVESAQHVDDQVVGESSLALVKEVAECLFELSEGLGALNQLGLHLRSDLLVELELLNDKVEVEHEGILNVLSDFVVQIGLDMQLAV